MVENGFKKIHFLTDGPAFDGSSLRNKSLGGSETALIQAARAMSDRGHDVTVYNNCPNPGRHQGVTYRSKSYYLEHSARIESDVLIVSRWFDFFKRPSPAALKVLWNHDMLDRSSGLRSVQDKIDLLFTLSRFHQDHYLARLPQLEGRVVGTRNGVDLELIDRTKKGTVKDPRKIIYASRPERGLQALLETIWPKLVEAHSDLRLYVCTYNTDGHGLQADLIDLYHYRNRLIDQTENVMHLGVLSKQEYYRHLAQSALMLYPCTFPEISCIAALEAQACLTPIITTDSFALSETVQVQEFKIPGKPGTEQYDQLFVNKTLEFLDDPGKAAEYASEARRLIELRYTWPKIVAEWDRIFTLSLNSRARTDRGFRTV
ncbi:MAG: glycosyltransferase family 4 protein [Deltaproteobacteria bacterium]|nr:glycosyltransferase family 4 protein [Deltaproteobacteria bacterium]